MTGLTKQDRINYVFGGGGHVVILGAGASIACANKNPLSNGKVLPSMDNFIEVVKLNDIIETIPEELHSQNFEQLYSNLHNDNPNSPAIIAIEERVREYFSDMKLPDEPTIYDYMVLALRRRDLIATFNWDPFLYQAWCRNFHIGQNPYIAFLHGNVALGYSKEDHRSGPANSYSRETLNYHEPTKLLYPVTNKNYNDDEFIKSQWDMTEDFLQDESIMRMTIFGYGAPTTDKEAMTLLNKAWGTSDTRVMEQFEMIDVREELEVKASWDNFINSHHYDYELNYFDSSLARNPRRTSESYRQHILPFTPDEAFSASNPVPQDFKTLEELWDWHRPLIEAEDKFFENN